MRRILLPAIVAAIVVAAAAGAYFAGVKRSNPVPSTAPVIASPGLSSSSPGPTGSEAVSATPEANIPEANIIVIEPVPNQEVAPPLRISGRARVFESQFNYRLRDEDGSILEEGQIHANAPDSGQYGNFDISVSSFPAPKGTKGTLEVFDFSPKDGSVIDLVKIPIVFSKTGS